MPKVYAPAYTGCASVDTGAAAAVILAPGESYITEFDLTDPRWHVVADGRAREIGALPEFTPFRIEHRAPLAQAAAPPGALWQGPLPSRAFNASGFFDGLRRGIRMGSPPILADKA